MYLGMLGSDGGSRVLKEDYHARYAQGHLLYVKEGTLLAQSFDLSTLSTLGEPVPVVEQVSFSGILAAFSASSTGVLTYRNAVSSGDDLQLTWVDRAGKPIATVGVAAPYYGVDLAPDGKRIAVHLHADQGGDIWVADSERGTMSRLTLNATQDNTAPVWSPDGRRIAYSSQRQGVSAIYSKASDGSGDEEKLLDSPPQFPKGAEELVARWAVSIVLDERQGVGRPVGAAVILATGSRFHLLRRLSANSSERSPRMAGGSRITRPKAVARKSTYGHSRPVQASGLSPPTAARMCGGTATERSCSTSTTPTRLVARL
jgi:dipeptidyl aminopeptidase/acylaminoacyl peptidase